MAEIFPFPALRYDPEKVRLADVVTQPYDKISPQMQERYYASSPHNLVRIILRRDDQTEITGGNRYTAAAECLHNWRKMGIFRQDSPSIYAYSQRFRAPGTSQVAERRGFIAAGKLCDYAEHVVYRHEQTLSKPKNDRLNLLRATHAHFGQIFMLYSDPAQSIDSLLFDGRNAEWQEVTDEYGVEHRVRRVADPALVNIVRTEMADRKLIIADGHHRYETALNFRQEAANSPNSAFRANAERVMMTFVNMDSPGLAILPTHRVVFGLPDFYVPRFLERTGKFYSVRKLEASDALDLLKPLAKSGKSAISFVAVTGQGNFLLTAKPESFAQIPTEFSARQRKLDVVHLHSLLLEQVLGISKQQIVDQQHVRYVRDAEEVSGSVAAGAGVNVGFLMNSVGIEQVREIAFAGEVLPQKSTDFYPKMLSGLAIFPLDEQP
jgi:uncharacterized protein (DUF1015 family)